MSVRSLPVGQGPRRSDRQSQPSLKARENSKLEALVKFTKQVKEQAKIHETVRRELISQPKAEKLESLLNEVTKGIGSVLVLYEELKTDEQSIGQTRRKLDKLESNSRSLVDEINQRLGDLADKESVKSSARRSIASVKSTQSSVSSEAVRATKRVELEALREKSEIEAKKQMAVLEKASRDAEIKRREALLDIEERESLRGESHCDGSSLLDPDESVFLVNETYDKQPHAKSVAFPDSTDRLVQALSASLSLARLPVPEPYVYNGDPLQFTDWSATFNALIDSKPVTDEEKIHYLKRYLGGPAREAVCGYFLLKKGDAYKKAREVLEKRFGDPFAVADSFRDKLEQWPRIPNRDPSALRKFADFLGQCEAAVVIG